MRRKFDNHIDKKKTFQTPVEANKNPNTNTHNTHKHTYTITHTVFFTLE